MNTRKIFLNFGVVCILVGLGQFFFAEANEISKEQDLATCPGWTKVPLQWDKTVKDFCSQYGEHCHAVESMAEPLEKKMILDPLFGQYDDFMLVNPNNQEKIEIYVKTEKPYLSAREINCQYYVLSAQESAKKNQIFRQKEECNVRGGQWMGHIEGRGRLSGCNMPTADEGKECHGKLGECQGPCVNDKCYGWTLYKGCDYIDQDGKSWCVE